MADGVVKTLEVFIMKKALIVTALAVGCVCSSFAAKKSKAGAVLNIACWNEEFQTRFKDYFEKKGLVPAGVKVNWIITPNADNAYQNALDQKLLGNAKLPADEKLDMFLVEADYALKYVDTDYTADVFKEIGLKKTDVAQQYKYTKDIMTSSKGVLKGVSWQACPGGLIYRRSIAKAVLGSDDPDTVQKAVSSWAEFDNTAAKMKAQGYFMLSGFDDAYRVFQDNIKTPAVDKSGKIVIDPQIAAWIKQTKTYTEKGYNNKANLWSAESFAGAQKNGKVFAYFGPAWFIDFSLAPATLDDPNGAKAVGNGSYGDWAFCPGPQGFSWGGTWVCAVSGTDNAELVRQIMYTLTCDEATLEAIAKDMGDFTNNVSAMEKVAKSTYKNPFLGGQNHIAFFLENAQRIDKSNMTMYDQGYTEKIQAAFADYFNGLVDYNTALNNFYTSMIELYPNLKK